MKFQEEKKRKYTIETSVGFLSPKIHDYFIDKQNTPFTNTISNNKSYTRDIPQWKQ